jgi:hypothetical protein
VRSGVVKGRRGREVGKILHLHVEGGKGTRKKIKKNSVA